MTSDEQTRSALSRLTENERECLRRRLLPQTAKEMARDLGISPHAVEKRLKMARAKLGLSSSLEAARLLAASRAYQSLVTRRSDLSGREEGGEERAAAAPPSGTAANRLPSQGLLMLMLLALLAFVAQDVPTADPSHSTMKADDGRDVTPRTVGLDEAAAFNRAGFGEKDRDHSGDLDPVEASAMEPRNRYRDASLPPPPPAGARDPAAERKWMDLLDHNRDGRVAVAEYVRYMIPWTLGTGVPADWHPRPQGQGPG